MRPVVLLGSGASLGAGMPLVGAIAERVFGAKNVLKQRGDFHLVDVLSV